MKKVLSILVSGAFSLALVSCGVANDGTGNRVGLNNGAGRRISQQNITGVNNNYRDGVYVGYGNAHGGSNEMAVVEVRNGRIIDIDLVNLDQQGYSNSISNMGGAGTRMSGQGTTTGGTNTARNSGTTGMNNGTTGTTGMNNGTTGMNNGTGSRVNTNISGNGNDRSTTIGNNNNNQTIRNYNNAMGNNTGNTTGNATNIGRNNAGIGGGNGLNNGTGTTTGNGTNTGVTGTNRNLGGAVGATLDEVRTGLISTMLRMQNYNVNYTNNNTTMTGTVDNWKLAVQRALAQARS